MNLAGRTLLIADANDTLRIAVRRAAERHGFLVQEATNGVDAVHRLTSYAIDAVLVDLDLPLLGGLEVSRVACAVGAELPVLVRVGRAIDGATLRAAISAGVSDCVERTCPIQTVIDRIETLLDPSRATTSSGTFHSVAIDELRTLSIAAVRA